MGGLYIYRNIDVMATSYTIIIYMEGSVRKWVLWILFYNIRFKSIYLPKY